MKKICFVVTLIVYSVFSLQMVFGHEFIVKPDSMDTQEGHKVGIKVGVKVLSAHVFMESEEVEPIDQVEVYKIASKRQDVKLQVNEQEKILEGELNYDEGTSYFLCGHRKPMIWTKTTEGWKQESKKNLSGVISSNVYEKFSKAYVGGIEDEVKYKESVGHRLEIVPLENPSNLEAGEELQVKVFFDGKPIVTELLATFDGFSSSPNTYAYFSKTNDKGEGLVKITSKGTWMVRVQHEIDQPNENYDKHVLRAVFLFGVGTMNAG